ncbi:MAG: flavodoxin-dependent (E)-4-hydroxy-3-methylbut-2-enyl-diphosphate synthase [Myxococcales bacterium]|nr:MAG: flavodoxin-dependent (E)-4-hydroxy-3-methylbut-2-enyl-diphosphate synthase [Myxococcales bacterium]
MRKPTRQILLGSVAVGGGAPISIQSMTTTHTKDVEGTISQAIALMTAGCDIVRVAVYDDGDAQAIAAIKPRINLPLVADIHFDYRLALAAVRAGVDGLRINPGNIGKVERVQQVVEAAKERNIPIRIGVNAGSLECTLLEKYGGPTAEAMVESAESHIKILEDLGYPNLKVSLKASTPMLTVKANRLFAERFDYPLHLGVTEAGPPFTGAVRSAAALTLLLSEGIGDTIRISLTADPIEEVRAARALLEALELRQPGLRVVSCPTCGRCQADGLIDLASRIEIKLSHIKEPITVAVMGCAVNGPGEAREADVGVAFGKGRGLLFRKGERVGVIPENAVESTLIAEVERLVEERQGSADGDEKDS